jgi:hypothetical protein
MICLSGVHLDLLMKAFFPLFIDNVLRSKIVLAFKLQLTEKMNHTYGKPKRLTHWTLTNKLPLHVNSVKVNDDQ